MMGKAMIAMSGGVDSSVAAYLMQERGFEIIGVTMHLFDNEDIGITDKTCCSLSDTDDARSVAARLGIPFYVLNFKDDFRRNVIDRFVSAYAEGKTPNPCIDCNRYLKFGKLITKMRELGFDYVVTGHYARISFDEGRGRYILRKAKDAHKDQSYVLYSLTQEQLSHVLLPLGELTKPEVREIAEKHGFVNARKRDSQDICFVPDGDYARFIKENCGAGFDEGDFVDRNGSFIAKHKGIIHYTVGQRRGLGIAAKAPYYVLSKDAVTNRVVLGSNEDLFADSLTAEDLNFISVDKLTEPMQVSAKIRYSSRETPAVITPLENGDVRVRFDEPQRAVTPGQTVVFYDGDIVVGGGTIK